MNPTLRITGIVGYVLALVFGWPLALGFIAIRESEDQDSFVFMGAIVFVLIGLALTVAWIMGVFMTIDYLLQNDGT